MPHGNLLSPTLLSAPPATPPRSNIGRAPADYAGPNCLPLCRFCSKPSECAWMLSMSSRRPRIHGSTWVGRLPGQI